MMLGLIYSKQDNQEKMESNYRFAYDLKPEDPQINQLMYLMLEKNKDLDGAILHLVKLCKLF